MENYEVFEFTIDMVNFLDEKFQIRINNEDSNFDSLVHLSEMIGVKIRQKRTIEIQYWSNQNNDVYYATGIRHKLRLPIIKKLAKNEEESELMKTDTTVLLLNSENYETYEFELAPLPTGMFWKVLKALSHPEITIDGVGYRKNGTPETEGPLGQSNLYNIKPTMIKVGNVFNSEFGGNSLDYSGSNSEIPGLIDSGGNAFIAY